MKMPGSTRYWALEIQTTGPQSELQRSLRYRSTITAAPTEGTS